MASGSIMSSAAGKPITDVVLIDNLPKEINAMKINDDKEGKVVLGNRMHTLYLISFFLVCLSNSHCDILIGNGSRCCGWEWN